jgi:predicted P-loop ATPase
MQKIWAEVYELWKKGESYFLTHEELLKLNSRNEDFTARDPFEDMVLSKYELNDSGDFTPSLDILNSFGISVPSARDYSRLNTAMKNLRAERKKKNGVRGYLLISKVTENF